MTASWSADDTRVHAQDDARDPAGELGTYEPSWDSMPTVWDANEMRALNRKTVWPDYTHVAPVTPIHGRRSTYVAPETPKHTMYGVYLVAVVVVALGCTGAYLLGELVRWAVTR